MPAIVSNIVEVYVFRVRSIRPEYLLLKRAPGDTLYPGIWQIVTGTMRTGERAVDAALRELKEETGFAPTRFWSVPHVDVFYDRTLDAMQLCPMFAAEVGAGSEPLLSAEHSAFQWAPAGPARERLVWPGQREGLDIVERFIAGGEAAMQLGLILPSTT